MLSVDELKQLPRTTRYNWNDFNHNDFYGHQWVEEYIKQFDDIKDVFQSRFTARAIKTILAVRRGYYHMLKEFVHNKNLLKMNAGSIVYSIEEIAEFSGITIRKACSFYGISKDWYYAQKQKIVCDLSPIKRCYKTHSNQLTISEVTTVEQLVKSQDNYRKPLSTIYYDAMNKNLIACGITSFRKYANALGYTKTKVKYKKRKIGFKASYVFEWLHVDITNIYTHNDGVQKVAFVKDNFSSALLHKRSTNGKAGSSFIASLLKETFEKYNLHQQSKEIHILSDGGSENKGAVTSWIEGIKAPPVVNKITAMTSQFPFSNSMSEITHSIYKSEYMGGKLSEDITSHLESLNDFMDYYNHHRYPCRLYGKTPMQIINGDSIDKFLNTQKIKQAQIARVESNRNFNACVSKLGCKPF